MTYELTVHPFKMGTDKEAAVKVLEEASEVREAWTDWDTWRKYPKCSEQYPKGCPDCDFAGTCEARRLPDYDYRCREHLADELADVIQAACNLADRYEIDLASAMERCERRNRDRGRYE